MAHAPRVPASAAQGGWAVLLAFIPPGRFRL